MTAAEPELLLDNLCFPEGPRWHDGRLWFSDMHGQEVVAVDLDGHRETIVEVPERPSGLGWLPDGRLLVVSMHDRRVLRLDSDGLNLHADLADIASWHTNDMLVDPQGRAYVGNFGFDLYGGASPSAAHLALIQPDGSVSVAAEDLLFPNGTVLTEDEKTLIVGETGGLKLTAFDVAEDGTLSGSRLWAQLDAPPDGITLDAEGCIWFAVPLEPGRFVRVAEGGEVKRQIELTDHGGFACMLGGPEGDLLFLLESKASHPDRATRGNARIRVLKVDVPHAGYP